MEEQPQGQQSRLFTVRVWCDDGGRARTAWHGKVQDVQSGAWRFFRDWEELSAFLQCQMDAGNEERAWPPPSA